jgi:hypothetical protein
MNLHYPETLLKMKDFLARNPIEAACSADDGRFNSAIDEETIVKHLMKEFHLGKDFILPKARAWYDMWLVKENLPVNIKSSTFASSDNACNFLSILWCFTDLTIDASTTPNKRKDIKELIKHARDFAHQAIERDYWFLVVKKDDPTNVICNSIKGLRRITPNPSNLPFQINWSKNIHYLEQPPEKSFEKCIKAIKEGYIRSALTPLSAL